MIRLFEMLLRYINEVIYGLFVMLCWLVNKKSYLINYVLKGLGKDFNYIGEEKWKTQSMLIDSRIATRNAFPICHCQPIKLFCL